MAIKYPFHDYESFKRWLSDVDPCDQYGFRKATNNEPTPDQTERLECNLVLYREYMSHQSRFPQHVHEQRKWEFERLRKIRLNDGQAHWKKRWEARG